MFGPEESSTDDSNADEEDSGIGDQEIPLQYVTFRRDANGRKIYFSTRPTTNENYNRVTNEDEKMEEVDSDEEMPSPATEYLISSFHGPPHSPSFI